MAKENIAFLVNLRKNIVEGSKMEGRYYPEAESKEALTTKGFARHVADHGGMVTYEFMQLVLASIVKCLKEMMSHGQPVKLDGLGTFRPTVTSVPGGAATIEEALRVGVNNLVQGVNFVFLRGGTSCGCEQSGAGCELRVSPRERPGRGDHFEEVQGSVLVAVRLPGGDRQEEDQRQGQVVHAPHAALCLGNYAE